MPERQTHLRDLRHISGKDEAVRETGTESDKRNLLQILKNPQAATRQDLVAAMCTNYAGDAYGDYQYISAIYPWGDNEDMTQPPELTLYGQFRKLYPQLAALSLDPGFLTHLPEAMALLMSRKVPNESPLQTLSELRQKMGTVTLYRGTTLSQAELHQITQSGHVSSLANYISSTENPKEQFESKALSVNINSVIEAHFHGSNPISPFLSVSTHPEVAIAVGAYFARKAADKRFYLIQLQVPVLDVLFYTPHGIRTPAMLRKQRGIGISIDDKETYFDWSEEVESFLFWKINPSDITHISEPQVQTSSWNGRVTQWK